MRGLCRHVHVLQCTGRAGKAVHHTEKWSFARLDPTGDTAEPARRRIRFAYIHSGPQFTQGRVANALTFWLRRRRVKDWSCAKEDQSWLTISKKGSRKLASK